jgi:hypothetical protein
VDLPGVGGFWEKKFWSIKKSYTYPYGFWPDLCFQFNWTGWELAKNLEKSS